MPNSYPRKSSGDFIVCDLSIEMSKKEARATRKAFFIIEELVSGG
jgi:hypothetical protein